MKLKKYLVLPVAATGSLYLTSCGDKGKETAANVVENVKAAVSGASDTASHVDTSAANFKEGSFSDYSQIIEDAIKQNAGDDLPDGMTPKIIVDALGFGNIDTYAQSSTPEGSEWVNKIRLDNGGKHKGLIKLFADTKYKDISVAQMAPEGTDLALQFGLNLKSAEGAILDFMSNGAEDKDIEEFKKNMGEQVPMLDMTASELLQKLDLRVNLALDMDPSQQLPTPFGSFDKPNLVIRLDGIGWVWEKVGSMAIGGTGLPFQKAEAGGVTTYSLPAEMAAQFMGFLPEVRVDSAKDQVWIASTSDFMAKSISGTNTLADSAAYKETMKGLPTEGQFVSYASKDFAQFASKLLTDLKGKGMLDSADEASKAQIESALTQLNKVQTGMAQVMSADSTGVTSAERGVQNIEQGLAEMKKAFETASKAK